MWCGSRVFTAHFVYPSTKVEKLKEWPTKQTNEKQKKQWGPGSVIMGSSKLAGACHIVSISVRTESTRVCNQVKIICSGSTFDWIIRTKQAV
jgi:hypothetical protein